MNRAVLGLALVVSIGSSACAGVYTDIVREQDGTYYLTRTKQGFFSTSGTLYRCQVVNAQAMRCAEIDSP